MPGPRPDGKRPSAGTTPGGYGIRPYGVGVDACIDPKGRRVPLSPNTIQ